MIIDLHQDLILSYEDDIHQFITFDPTSYKDHHGTNAGSLQDYTSGGVSLIRGVSRPYTLQGDLRDKINRKITYSPQKLSKYLSQYKELETSGAIHIVQRSQEIKKSHLNILLHIEGFDNVQSLDDIKHVYDQGVRSIGFVRNFDNSLSACNLNSSNDGLTNLGKQAVEYMNTLGMIVDTAHMSHQAMMDTITYSQKPILNSHSNLIHFFDHKRNVQDEFLRALPDNGGVLGLSFCKSFMTKESSIQIDSYFDQIDYVRNMIGDEHIALGTDYHGLTHEDIIDGYSNIASIKTLHELMTNRYGESFTHKFLYTNAERVIKAHL